MLPEAGGRANDSEEAIERADLETKQRRDAEDVWLAATFRTQRGRHDAVPDGVDDDVGHGDRQDWSLRRMVSGERRLAMLNGA